MSNSNSNANVYARARLGIEKPKAWAENMHNLTFGKAERDDVTLLIAGLTQAQDYFLQGALSGQGYNMLALDAPDNDARRKLHGHSYLVRLHLKGPIDEVMGWAMDYGDVKTVFAPLHWQLDHHPLDDLVGVDGDSSLETLLHWIRDQLRRDIDILNRIDLYETPGCGAILCDSGDTAHLLLGTDMRL